MLRSHTGKGAKILAGLFAFVFLAALVGVFKPYIKGAKRWHFGLGAFLSFVLVGALAEPQPNKKSTANEQSLASPASAPAQTAASDANTNSTPEAPDSEWSYSTAKDEMRGSETRYAQVEAIDTIDLDFPYGEQRGLILIRQSPKFGFDLLVGVRSGQIMCNSFSNSYISVKFDDGPIRRYGCSESSDGSSSMIFVNDGRGFLANLKKSKKVMVEAEFFQNGLQQMTFNTANLKWED